MEGELFVIILLAIIVLIVIAKTAIVVPQQSAYVVERLGRYSGTLGAGFHLASLMPTDARRLSLPLHRAMLEAIKKRNPEQARMATLKLLAESEVDLKNLLATNAKLTAAIAPPLMLPPASGGKIVTTSLGASRASASASRPLTSTTRARSGGIPS